MEKQSCITLAVLTKSLLKKPNNVSNLKGKMIEQIASLVENFMTFSRAKQNPFKIARKCNSVMETVMHSGVRSYMDTMRTRLLPIIVSAIMRDTRRKVNSNLVHMYRSVNILLPIKSCSEVNHILKRESMDDDFMITLFFR